MSFSTSFAVLPGDYCRCCFALESSVPKFQRHCLMVKLKRGRRESLRSLRINAKDNKHDRKRLSKSMSRRLESSEESSSSRHGPVSAPSLIDLEPEEAPLGDSRTSNRKTFMSARQEEDDSRAAFATSASSSGSVSIQEVSIFGIIGRKLLKRLSSLQLAVAELFIIIGLSAVGTIVEQGESPDFYFQYYPEDHPVLGFLTWRVVLGLSLDHIYTAPYFLGLLLLLAVSLMACTSTRQLPIVRVAKRIGFIVLLQGVVKFKYLKNLMGWKMIFESSSFDKTVSISKISDSLTNARIGDLSTLLMVEGYEVFLKGPLLYAFKGLAGRFAPIGVHISLLLIMTGATLSALGGYHGSVMVPQGLSFPLGEFLKDNGFLSTPSSVMNLQVHVNKFSIDYRPTGEVAQFHSDLSLLDIKDKEIYRRPISVNDPLRYGGLTIYQSDWAIAAVQIRVDGSDSFNLVMAALEKGDNKLFGTFLPLGEEGLANGKGISILARDLQSVVIYDHEGKFVGVRRSGSSKPLEVDGVSILVDDIIGSTGLELKMDPGVPVVYAGFGGLMLTTCISYLSHAQVWALQDGTNLIVGGKSNRGKMAFEINLNEILDTVPEILSQNQSEVLVSNSNIGEVDAISKHEDLPAHPKLDDILKVGAVKSPLAHSK